MQKTESSLEINNLTGFDVSGDFLTKISLETLKKGAPKCLSEKKINISLALVSGKEISKLNSRYREKNQPTDVLSFSEYAKIQDLCNNVGKELFLGEIVLCPEYISKSSKEQKVSFEYEMAYIFSHGILHLLGFSHGKKMFSLQEDVAQKATQNFS